VLAPHQEIPFQLDPQDGVGWPSTTPTRSVSVCRAP